MSRLEQLESLLREQPDDPFLIYALALEYENTSNTMQALLMYEHLITDYPAYIATYYQYAKLLLSAGNRTGGLDLLRKGIEEGKLAGDHHAVSEMQALFNAWSGGSGED